MVIFVSMLIPYSGMRAPPRRDPPRPSSKTQSVYQVGGFNVHPDSNFSKLVVDLGVDIKSTAKMLHDFETQLGNLVWNEAKVTQAMNEYHNFMTLKAKNPDLYLVPSFPVEMVWISHMLRPKMYQDDCKRLYGRLIDHSFSMTNSERFLRDQAVHDTTQFYRQTFPEEKYNFLFYNF